MCLYGKLIRNPKYKKTQKNGGIIPTINDHRVSVVPIGCGNCIECRKQKAREWQVRLLEDVRTNKNGKFITLTFSNEWIKKIVEGYEQPIPNTNKTRWIKGIDGLEGYDLDNEIATRGLRHWNEKWRKTTGKAIRHWAITELGHKGTENIHIHAIVWTNETELIRDTWQYGWIYPRYEYEWSHNYVNEKTVNYIIKYVHKIDKKNETYKSKILTSSGIGSSYTSRMDSKNNEYNEGKTNECYKTRSGHKIAMPAYWRNKIYTEEQREKLWIEKLNKEIRYVMKEKIDISKGEKDYYKTLEYYQKRNSELGYGNDKSNNWEKKEYEKQRRNLLIQDRINKQKEPTERTHLSNNKNKKQDNI